LLTAAAGMGLKTSELWRSCSE